MFIMLIYKGHISKFVKTVGILWSHNLSKTWNMIVPSLHWSSCVYKILHCEMEWTVSASVSVTVQSSHWSRLLPLTTLSGVMNWLQTHRETRTSSRLCSYRSLNWKQGTTCRVSQQDRLLSVHTVLHQVTHTVWTSLEAPLPLKIMNVVCVFSHVHWLQLSTRFLVTSQTWKDSRKSLLLAKKELVCVTSPNNHNFNNHNFSVFIQTKKLAIML